MSRKQKNPIWQFFEKNISDLSKAVCKLCNNSYSLGSHEPKKQTLHGLKLHLSKFHDAEHRQMLKRQAEIDDLKKEIKLKRTYSNVTLELLSTDQPNLVQSTIPSFTSKSKLVQWPDDHEITKRIDKAIMDLIIVDMLPYALVESEAFRRLNFTDPLAIHKYRMKSEKYFRTSLMPKTYEIMKTKVMTLIAKSEWVSITTDIWTNAYKTCSLLSFTAHFIVKHQRLKVILGACVLEQDHTSQYIEQKITEMVNNWSLNGKIFLVLRDNAANMVCAMRGKYESIGCIAHTLQLVIKQALFSDEETKKIFKKCRKIVGHFRHSEQATRKLRECQKQCGLPEHTLVQDVDVRWNSTYLMLQKLLEQKNAVNLYIVEHGKIDTLLSNEWNVIKNVTAILKFFHEATLDLSFSDACISIVIPLISLLSRKVQVRCSSDDEMMTNMKNSLYETLNIKFSFIKKNTSLMVATMLDPRFKSKYLNSNEVDLAITEIVSFLTEHNNNDSVQSHGRENPSVSTSTELVSPDSNIHQEKESLWDVHDNIPDPMEIPGSEDQKTILREIIQSYLSEPLLQRNADIYCYWNSSPYSTLRKAVLKYLSAPPTSVPSEQLFSAAGQIYSDRRNNLLGENVEKLLFLAYNIRLFNYEY
ncbi:unnamed protein product [Euphydryas editha]|uniref:BED-type domain-containing protein n=1 Tax=Euphydryas editha TaxID=104508 RepID=A0AAU9UVP0_EUPED|nr:unnamed protein product [Euphydryas editha]